MSNPFDKLPKGVTIETTTKIAQELALHVQERIVAHTPDAAPDSRVLVLQMVLAKLAVQSLLLNGAPAEVAADILAQIVRLEAQAIAEQKNPASSN